MASRLTTTDRHSLRVCFADLGRAPLPRPQRIRVYANMGNEAEDLLEVVRRDGLEVSWLSAGTRAQTARSRPCKGPMQPLTQAHIHKQGAAQQTGNRRSALSLLGAPRRQRCTSPTTPLVCAASLPAHPLRSAGSWPAHHQTCS